MYSGSEVIYFTGFIFQNHSVTSDQEDVLIRFHSRLKCISSQMKHNGRTLRSNTPTRLRWIKENKNECLICFKHFLIHIHVKGYYIPSSSSAGTCQGSSFTSTRQDDLTLAVCGFTMVFRMSEGSCTVIMTHVTRIRHAHWSGAAKHHVRSCQVCCKPHEDPYGCETGSSLQHHRKWPATRTNTVTLTGCPSGHEHLSHPWPSQGERLTNGEVNKPIIIVVIKCPVWSHLTWPI